MQKKILMFIPTFPVLSETFIERDVDALVRSRKVDVKVITTRKGVKFRSKRAAAVTDYRRLKLGNLILGFGYFFTRPRKVFKALRVLGLRRIYLFIKSLGYAKIFSEYSSDYIYAQFLSKPSTIALSASIILDIPFAVSAHARDVLEYPDLVKEKVKYAKFISFCNKNALNKARELAEGLPTDNLKLVYHGIDSESLVSKGDLIENTGTNFIFSVGRLTEKKGIKYLIRASEVLNERGVKHTIVIAGGGPLFEELEEEVRGLGLSNTITFLGSTPFEDVVSYFRTAAVYVQPAINTETGDADGVPNTLIEAALLEVPIVTTDAGSISDFLNSDSAIIVKQHHVEGLADAIQRLLTDKEYGKQLSANAFVKARELFDIDKSIKIIEDLFLN